MLLENNSYPHDVRVRNEALALTRAGHAVTVIAPRSRGEARCETIDGVGVRRYRSPSSSGSLLGYLLEYGVAHVQLSLHAVRELLRGARVVHLHNPPDTLFSVGLLARAVGGKMVFDQHDLTPELYGQLFGRSRLLPLLRAAQHASLRSADLVLFTNESQRRVALERNGLDGSRTVVVRNGPLRRTLNLADGRDGVLTDPRLVYVGQLGPQDGVLELPAILASLHREFDLPGARLTVVGAGPCGDEIASRAAALGVDDRLRLTGGVPPEDVPGLIREADICIDPAPCNALNHHSTMLKIAEYLAAARPVVAYELLETKYTAGDAALYAGCDDQRQFAALIAELAGDPGLRATLAGHGSERSADLVWERSEESLLEAYGALW
jgi:glycosyltransferase involved in cell wall biosynthesis